MIVLKSPEKRIEALKKSNRILARKLGNAEAALKVDIGRLRADSFKEGYNTCEQQMKQQKVILESRIKELEQELLVLKINYSPTNITI